MPAYLQSKKSKKQAMRHLHSQLLKTLYEKQMDKHLAKILTSENIKFAEEFSYGKNNNRSIIKQHENYWLM